jgi:CheY-like chemotaxis protein/class 3 adenylate cyclase
MQTPPLILIVDDEPFNVEVLEQELEDLGYATLSAADGRAAVERVAAHAPDLVLLDIMMPVMDGFAVLAALKAAPATRDLPVIVISANSDMPSVVRGIAQGAEDYLPKPFDPVLLQARISACLEKKRLRDQEAEYLRQVERLTAAAGAVEADRFDIASLNEVAARPDTLGGLARVFQRMAREVHAREQRLRAQLQQARLDAEERRRAAAETLVAYLPMDRRQALARGTALPEQQHGAAIFADISGFSALTAALAQELGMQRGAEEITRQLNRVYGVLVDEVHRSHGSVIGFSGDAITCWFGDASFEFAVLSSQLTAPETQNSELKTQNSAAGRAVSCALAMQAAIGRLGAVTTPAGRSIALAIKVGVASGPARRLLVGDPALRQVEVLAGRTVDEVARAEHLAGPGEVLASAALVAAVGARVEVADWRADPASGERFALLAGLAAPVDAAPWEAVPADAISAEQVRPWLAPVVYELVRDGRGAFLSELRPAAALFLAFDGLDYDGDPRAGAQLDAFVRWVQSVLRAHDGTLVQVTIGDKGSYLYAAFGVPVTFADDATRAVLAAMALKSPPSELSPVAVGGIGVAYGASYAGAYGGAEQRSYGVIGDRANLAARLMQLAAGDILCDEEICRAATRLQFEALAPVAVKGRLAPTPAFRPLPYSEPSDTAAGIDLLAPAQQLTLKVASVIGREFALRLLQAILPGEAEQRQVEAHLLELERLGFVRPGQDAPVERTYSFVDNRLREVAYGRLPFAQRRQLHRAVAEWYEQTHAADLAPHAGVLAHHWGCAENPTRTAHYLELASEQARGRGDHQAALRYLDELLALNVQAAVLSDEYHAAAPAGDSGVEGPQDDFRRREPPVQAID